MLFRSELPPIDEQKRTVRLRVRRLVLEAHERIRALRNIKVERRHEKANTGAAIRKTLRQVARLPTRRVEPRQVPTLALAEQPTLVVQPADLVRIAVMEVSLRQEHS